MAAELEAYEVKISGLDGFLILFRSYNFFFNDPHTSLQ